MAARPWRRSGATEVALYENRIALADRELSAGEPGRAIDLLDRVRSALRGWEWFHLQGRRRFDEAELDGSNVVTVAAAYHPGGTILATGYGEKGIAIWEAGDRGLKRRQVIAAHNLDVTSLAFSSDGRLMVFDELRRGGEGLGYRPVGGPARAPGPAGGSSLGRRDTSR